MINDKLMNESILEKQLIEAGFPGLFMYGERSLADSIWEKGEQENQLERIILSQSASDHGKFLASEMLRKYNVPVKGGWLDFLPNVYASALKNTSEDVGNKYMLNGNLWGFLYEMDDPGYLGKQLVSFGHAAIPYLKELLEDQSSILYEGSQEATLGNQYQYRVKDFAAFYLSKIMDVPIRFYQEMDKRDKEIEKLREIINK